MCQARSEGKRQPQNYEKFDKIDENKFIKIKRPDLINVASSSSYLIRSIADSNPEVNSFVLRMTIWSLAAKVKSTLKHIKTE